MAMPAAVRVNPGKSDDETKAILKAALAYYLEQATGRAEFTLLRGNPDFDRFLEDLAKEVMRQSQKCGKSQLVGPVAALMKLNLGDEQTNQFACNFVKKFRVEKSSLTQSEVRFMLNKFWMKIILQFNPDYWEQQNEESARNNATTGARG